uniref:EGF-like domain-containing protein n=1 Tax=Plectus sambesii TaxID=2011161 RepID=A0A914WPB3_9BILA
MYGHLGALMLLLASAAFARNHTCKNGGSPTGNNQAPCYCPPPFYGKYCEYSINATSTAAPPNNASTTSSWNGNATTTSFWSGNASATAWPSDNSTKCMNGGVLIGNFCYCYEPYVGDRCQYGGNITFTSTPSSSNATTTRSWGNSVNQKTVFPANHTFTTPSQDFSTTALPFNNSTHCFNGGIQIGNYCYCPSPYYGDHCQFSGSNATEVRFKRAIANVFRGIFDDIEQQNANVTASSLPASSNGNSTTTTAQPVSSSNATVTGTSGGNSTTTSYANFTSTASPSINATVVPAGNSTQCFNEGIQIGQYCYCRAPYYGDRCQYNSSAPIRRVRSINNRRQRHPTEETVALVLEKSRP